MKLVRNTTPGGTGKYAVIKLHQLPSNPSTVEELAAAILANPEAVVFGGVGKPDEFFVMMLKDRHAGPALLAYASNAMRADPEYAVDVAELASRAGFNSPYCKAPD